MTERRWMEIMTWFSTGRYRPLVLIVLAQNDGVPLDEMTLASQAGMFNQQMSGNVVETAVMIKQIFDLEKEGYVERAEDGMRWQMTKLGLLVSRQWVQVNVEPPERGPFDHDVIRIWRDRVISYMEHDAQLAEESGIDRGEWIMTQNQRLVEMHVLNRILGEERMPGWMEEFQRAAEDPEDMVGSDEA